MATAGFKDTKKEYYALQQFKGIDTKSGRTVIQESEFSWLENAIPIGNGNLRSVPGPTVIPGVTWSSPPQSAFIANISNTTYIVAFEQNGGAEYYNQTTGVQSTLAAAGKFSASGVQTAMWENTHLLIIDPVKGYFAWDGTHLVSIGSVGAITVTAGGSGFYAAPAVTISAPNEAGGIQAVATATAGTGASSVGTVTGILVTNPGSGYTAVPGVAIDPPPAGGTQATASAELSAGTIVAIVVTNPGAGYTSVPAVTISGGGGTAAAATASLSSGPVTAITLSEAGTGYTSAPTIGFSGGGGTGATATAQIISQPGQAIAVFAGRVWIAQGRTIYYTAPNSFEDFITVSAGNVTLTDSVLFGNITALVSANSYLYIFGEDSINIISDVSVTSTGSTIFTNTNISASVGTTLTNAIFPYFRSILLMNTYGVYALVGATTTKISDPLDGVFQYIDFTQPIYGGQFVIDNDLCAAFGFTYNDPVQGARYLMAVFFDKKWWLSSQTYDFSQIVSIPNVSGITLYGISSTSVYSLMTNNATPVLTTIQTPLISFKNPVQDKQLLKLGIEATSLTSTMNVSLDNEIGGSDALSFAPQTVNWINNSGATILWTNSGGTVIGWYGSSYSLYKSDASQYGKYIGVTITVQDTAFILNGILMQYELRATF